jgi:hypothetical protein
VMNDLIEFLRAQLDKDERVARESKGSFWNTDGHSYQAEAFMDRFDENRELREVDAKRRILELHSPEPEDWATHIAGDCRMCAMEMPCSTVRMLALPYAARPDYREEWRP